MKLKITLSLILISISFSLFAESRKLTADEVKETFTDKTIKGENYISGKTVRIYAGSNGEWISNPGGMKMINFKWSVNSSGEHCKKGKGQQGCGPIISKGEPNIYYKQLKGEERFKFTIIGDGNQLLFAGEKVNGEKLNGEQIKTLLSDKTVDIEKVDINNKKKKHFSAYTAEDGSRIIYIPWKNKKSERKWWVEGDKYCGSHPKKGDYCRDMVDAGNGSYHVLYDGKHLRTFSNFRDGNQL